MRKRLFTDFEKYCPGCKGWKPLDDFGVLRSAPSGRRSRCKPCFRRQNAPHARRYSQGMDDAGLRALWERQGRKCAICREPLPLEDRHACHVDLDKATREVKGLLCPRCDLGMASFRESLAILAEAAKYQRRFEMERRNRHHAGLMMGGIQG